VCIEIKLCSGQREAKVSLGEAFQLGTALQDRGELTGLMLWVNMNGNKGALIVVDAKTCCLGKSVKDHPELGDTREGSICDNECIICILDCSVWRTSPFFLMRTWRTSSTGRNW
jgi:hypothetical protein